MSIDAHCPRGTYPLFTRRTTPASTVWGHARAGTAGGMEIGYALSSEEHAPVDLVRNATRAEEAGFAFSLISDHYHPWIDRQGQYPFVWSVIGAIAASSPSIRLGTGVTCPLIRIHPAIVAQAAATSAAMMPGRFFLGVGTGENLNEHVLGDRWPSTRERREMLEEAIDVMRLSGRATSAASKASTTGSTMPVSTRSPTNRYRSSLPLEASKRRSSRRVRVMASSRRPRRRDHCELSRRGRLGPNLWNVDRLLGGDRSRSTRDRPRVVAERRSDGPLGQELPLPSHFEQAAAMVDEERSRRDRMRPRSGGSHPRIREFADAGFDHVYVHQVGPDQNGFIDFYEREVLDKAERLDVAA